MKKYLLLLSISTALLPSIGTKEANEMNLYNNVKCKSSFDTVRPGDGINVDGLKWTIELEVASLFNGIKTEEEYSTPTYKSGFLDNYYNFILNNVTMIEGVYSHFNNYVSKSLLSSGNYHSSYNQSIKYYQTLGYTIFFENKVSSNFERVMNAAFGFNTTDFGSTNTLTLQSDFNYEYDYRYSTRKTIEKEAKYSFSVNDGIANHCPDGYSMTIGTVAKYYIIDLSYRNVVKLWLDEKKDSYEKMTILVVDESSLKDTFVYQRSPSNGTSYYLPIND